MEQRNTIPYQSVFVMSENSPQVKTSWEVKKKQQLNNLVFWNPKYSDIFFLPSGSFFPAHHRVFQSGSIFMSQKRGFHNPFKNQEIALNLWVDDMLSKTCRWFSEDLEVAIHSRIEKFKKSKSKNFVCVKIKSHN